MIAITKIWLALNVTQLICNIVPPWKITNVLIVVNGKMMRL
jgi:hypothetical protein